MTKNSTGNSNEGPVLVAVDFSADSEAALLWAGNYATCMKAPMLILHVVHDPAFAPGYYRKDEDDWSRPMAALAEEMLAEFMKRMRAAHPGLAPLQDAETVLVTGLPPGRIVEEAEQAGAQIIIVGSRGRTGLPHIMLGSVAERVSQIASMPVVIVKGKKEKDAS